MRWAADIGPATRDVVAKIFGSVQIKEQAYNPALAVLNLSKRYAERDLESACAYAFAKASSPRYPFLKSVLAHNASQEAVEEQERGGYIRGE